MNAKRILSLTGIWVITVAGLLQAEAPGSPGQQAAADRIEFKCVHELGSVEKARVETKTIGSMKMFEAIPDQKFSQTFEQDLEFKCVKINKDGSAVYAMSMPRIAMNMSVMGMNQEFDSDTFDAEKDSNPATAMMGKIFTAMTKIRCNVTLAANGEPLKLEGYSESMAKVLDDVKDEVPAPVRKMFDKLMEFMGNDAMQEQMRSGFRSLPPGGTARIGDKWEQQWQFNMGMFGMDLHVHGQYELVGIEEYKGRRCAKIRFTSAMTSTPTDKSTEEESEGANKPKGIFERMNMQMTMSDGKGVAYWDYQTGDMLLYRETGRLAMEMELNPDPHAEDEGAQKGMKITYNLQTSTNVSLLDEDEDPKDSAQVSATTTQPATVQPMTKQPVTANP